MALRLLQRRYSTFFSRNSSRIGAPIQESISRNAFSCKSSTISLPISRNSASHKRFYFKNREYDDQGRFYFKNREYNDEGYWFHNPKRVRFTLIFLSCGVLLGVSSGKWFTVPYSERRHFVLFHKFLPKIVTYGSKIKIELASLHPDTFTATRIFHDIIHEASQIQMETKPFLFEIEFATPGHDNRKKQDEKEKGIESEKFQIIVVNSPTVGAACTCGSRKIYVTSAMLRRYQRHGAIIATIFGHEVGHTLAGHYPELISKFLCVMSGIGMSLYLFTKSSYVRSKLSYLDRFMRLRFIPSFCFVLAVPLLSYLPMTMYSRKLEVEADYMGLMLAASGGYNPLVGSTFPIYGVKRGKDRLPKCFYPVPSGEERCEILADPRIINEAVSRHRQGRELRQGTQPPVED